MMINADEINIELLIVIVNNGLGSKILKYAKQNGITGGTIFLGKGTAANRILEFFDLYDVRKELVLMMAEKTTANKVLEKINKEFHFQRPNHGIAFSTSVGRIIGVSRYKDICVKERGVIDSMYNAIYVIIDKGRAEDVIEAAARGGSRGGTVINARGSGIHETSKLFSMDIEPEKEIVLILSKADKVDPIVSSIKESLKIDEPGNGVIFVQDVSSTYGLYEK